MRLRDRAMARRHVQQVIEQVPERPDRRDQEDRNCALQKRPPYPRQQVLELPTHTNHLHAIEGSGRYRTQLSEPRPSKRTIAEVAGLPSNRSFGLAVSTIIAA